MRQRTSFSVLFYIMRTRLSKKGEAPILLRVTMNGTRSVCSTNLKVDPNLWNNAAGKSKGHDRISNELNQHLDTIQAKIMQIHRQLEMDGKVFDAQTVVDTYQGKNDKPQIMLLDVFRDHNERCRKLMGKDMAPGTVERYDTSLRLTQQFIQQNFGKNDIPIADVNHKFITDYEFFFKTVRNCSHNTTTKYLKNFKKIIRIALANEYITKDPFVNIHFSLDEVDKDYLTDEEVLCIYQKEFSIERLAQVRDFFLFSCYTGLAFSDLKGLCNEHLVQDNQGRMWIRKKRQKTKNMCNIPLLDIPIQIIEKYKTHPQCATSDRVLPVISNTKMNAYLKEIADICGINKQVSTHTARHTFATSVGLANGVSIENVAKMLGHSDTKMTRHYAKVLDKSIMHDMLNVNEKLKTAHSI